ncbi:MAG: HEAT repeat domain-containing protein [Candidatus Hermodarchaeota archaeon]
MNHIDKYLKILTQTSSPLEKIRAITGIMVWTNNPYQVSIAQRKEIISLFINNLKDTHRRVKHVSIWALGILGHPRALKPLREILRSSSDLFNQNELLYIVENALAMIKWTDVSHYCPFCGEITECYKHSLDSRFICSSCENLW